MGGIYPSTQLPCLGEVSSSSGGIAASSHPAICEAAVNALLSFSVTKMSKSLLIRQGMLEIGLDVWGWVHLMIVLFIPSDHCKKTGCWVRSTIGLTQYVLILVNTIAQLQSYH